MSFTAKEANIEKITRQLSDLMSERRKLRTASVLVNVMVGIIGMSLVRSASQLFLTVIFLFLLGVINAIFVGSLNERIAATIKELEKLDVYIRGVTKERKE
jgi:hypothetical protein